MSSGVKQFTELLRELYSKPSYLIPMITAQREFRTNNYQMGSASQLEDLFFDTLSFYSAENQLDSNPKRRTGKESWDYVFFDQPFSHKESLKGGFTYKWQPGKRTDTKKWHALEPTVSFTEPVVLSFSNLKMKMQWTPNNEENGKTIWGKIANFNYETLNLNVYAKNSKLIMGTYENKKINILESWNQSEIKSLDLSTVIKSLGKDNLIKRDLWLISTENFKEEKSLPNEILIQTDDILPGIYILELDQLQEVEVVANNKAHSVSDETAYKLMRESISRGNYLNIPLWPTIFADITPPNLYQIQRIKYDAAMKPGGPRAV